ncbi:MAG: hypothetical protein F4X34_04850 [Chloroflexi bacterium]|nr:hypothetical protein [Chloroflexota bacterium]
MATHPSMNDFFQQLDKWRHFPAFPLEARSEVFFALFLPTVLEAHFKIGIKPQIIPQFPLKQESEGEEEDYNLFDKVDFFALSNNDECAFLIELKTDMKSRRSDQDDYLTNAIGKGMCRILHDFKEMSKSKNDKRARQKYFHMAHALSEFGLIGLPSNLKDTMYAAHSQGVYELIDDICILRSPELKVVYVQPYQSDEDKCGDKRFSYIYFDEFADIVESQGDMGGLFAGYLRKWIEDPAKSPPR